MPGYKGKRERNKIPGIIKNYIYYILYIILLNIL